MDRPLCTVCHGNPVAINYHSGDRVRYRRVCSSCSSKGKKVKPKPLAWAKTGYTKKLTCEKCNFKAKTLDQMFVFYIDGNLKNNDWVNLRSVCANCRIEINNSRTTWKPSPLLPDF